MSRRFLTPAPRSPVRPGEIPTFSIAIGAYNAHATIAETLESAFAQTAPPKEIVVVDDGSSDGTADVVERFGERVILIRQENRGATVAKNRAAEATSADFVAFLDADDIYLPHRLEAMGELAAARPDLDVITTNAELEVDGEIAGLYYPDIHCAFPVEDQSVGVIANDSTILGAAAVRRSAYFAAGGMRPGLATTYDWELWMVMALRGSLFGCVDEPLYRYRLHEHGASSDLVGGFRDATEILERLLATEDASPEERAALQRSHDYYRRNALLTRAEASLRSRAPGARRHALEVARDATHPPVTRAKAVVAAVSPAVARALLVLRERRGGASRLRKPLPNR